LAATNHRTHVCGIYDADINCTLKCIEWSLFAIQQWSIGNHNFFQYLLMQWPTQLNNEWPFWIWVTNALWYIHIYWMFVCMDGVLRYTLCIARIFIVSPLK
jgi:hypothetical protein